MSIQQNRKADSINARVKPLPNEQGRYVCECGSTFGTFSAGINAMHTTSERHQDYLYRERTTAAYRASAAEYRAAEKPKKKIKCWF